MAKRGKQQKYAVFNVRQLRNMIASTKGQPQNTVVLRFETASKKHPGQLRSKKTWWK